MPCVLVDADACAVKQDIARLAARRSVPVLFVGNAAPAASAPCGVEFVAVGDGPDAADFEIVARAARGDIVVTDDIGLAAMALPKGARCLSSRGRIYDDKNIGSLMASRHIGREIRAAGGRTRGPAPFTAADRRRFRAAFCALLDGSLRAPGG